jgi:hypothetical protein
MQFSCPGLSLVTRAAFTVMTLRETNNHPNGKFKINSDRKSQDWWRVKSKACSSFSLTLVIVQKEFVLAGQTVPHTAVSFYGDYGRICEDFVPNFAVKETGYCFTTTRRLTLSCLPGNCWPQTKLLLSPTPLYFSVSPFENKTDSPPFWHNLCDRGMIAGGAEHPHRTRLPRCV